jgi:hypothetical protein
VRPVEIHVPCDALVSVAGLVLHHDRLDDIAPVSANPVPSKSGGGLPETTFRPGASSNSLFSTSPGKTAQFAE